MRSGHAHAAVHYQRFLSQMLNNLPLHPFPLSRLVGLDLSPLPPFPLPLPLLHLFSPENDATDRPSFCHGPCSIERVKFCR
jgi:hypothetical protein